MSLNLFNCFLNSQLIKPFVPIGRVVSMTCFELLKKANHYQLGRAHEKALLNLNRSALVFSFELSFLCNFR